MSLLSGLGKRLRDLADEAGSVITGQPAHGSAPSPTPPPVSYPALQPTQQNPIQSIGHGLADIGNFAQRIGYQLNPVDNNQTFKNPVPTAHLPVKTQLSNIGKGLVNSTIEPVERIPTNATVGLSNVLLKAAHQKPVTVQQVAKQPNATLRLGASAGATGSPKQLAGDVAQTGLSLLTPELRGAGVIKKTAAASAIGAGINASSAFGQGGNLKQIGKAAEIGGVVGASIPLAAHGSVAAVRSLGNASRTAALKAASQGSAINQIPIKNLTSYEGAPDTARVNAYKKQIQAGKPIEPLIAMKDTSGNLGVEDGKHRLEAYRQLGIKTAPVRVTTPEKLRAVLQGGYIGSRDIPEPDKPKGFILKETNPRGGRQDVIRIKRNPETGHLEPSQESIVAPKTAALEVEKPSEARAMTNMHDILNSGGTVDEALMDYMNNRGGNYNQAKLALQKVLNAKSLDKKSVNAKLNPLYGSVRLGNVGEGDTTQAILNRKAIADTVQHYGSKAQSEVGKLTPHDLALMDETRTAPVKDLADRAEDKEQFTKAANAVKQYNDYTHAAGSGLLGQEVPYRQNYGAPLLFDDSPENQAMIAAAKAQLKNRPGYSQHRTFANYSEATQFGVKRANKNFAEDLAQDIQRRSNDLGQLALAKGLEEAHPGKVKVGEIGVTPDGMYKQLSIPGGSRLSLPADLADEINKRGNPTPASGMMNTYDKANAGLKYLKLGGGLFHMLTESMNFLGHQIASGNVLKDPAAQARVIGSTFSKAIKAKSFEYFEANGTMEKARVGGVTIKPEEILADANIKAVDRLNKANPIRAVHDAVFEREIPVQKLSIFEQATKGLSIDKPEDLVKIRQAATAVNHIFGGLNRATDTHVFSPQTAKYVSRILLATDFTEAKINTVRDALTRADVQGNIARQAVLGKTIVAAAPGLIALSATGKINWNDPKDVGKKVIDQVLDPHFPTPFKTKSGILKIAKTPETFISEFGRLFTPLFADGPNKLGNEKAAIQHYLTARLAALPSSGLQVASNQDYYGNPVIQRDQNGKIQLKQTAENLGLQGAPIPVAQGVQVARGNEKPGEAILNTAGFRTKADPNDPRMKVLNFQNQVVNGLNPQDKAAWNVAHGKVTDQYGNLKTTVTPADLLNRYTTELADPAVLAADKAINDYKKSQGQPGDPFYELTPEQQKKVLVIKSLSNLDRGDNSGSAAIMKEQNKGWYDKYVSDTNSYYDKLNLPPSTKTRLVQEPSVSPELEQVIQGAKGLTGADYAAYSQAHPELQDYYAQLNQAVRQQRDFYDEPQFKDYPAESAHVQALFDSMPQGNDKAARKARAILINSNPDLNNYLADVAMWQLNQGAAKARFEGQNYTQKDLKNLYSIGNYDVTKLANGLYAQTAGTLADGTPLSGNGYFTGTPGVNGGTGFTAGTAPTAGGGFGQGHYNYHKRAPRFYRRKTKKLHLTHAHRQHKVHLERPKSPIKIKNKVNQNPGIKVTKTFL